MFCKPTKFLSIGPFGQELIGSVEFGGQAPFTKPEGAIAESCVDLHSLEIYDLSLKYDNTKVKLNDVLQMLSMYACSVAFATPYLNVNNLNYLLPRFITYTKTR